MLIVGAADASEWSQSEMDSFRRYGITPSPIPPVVAGTVEYGCSNTEVPEILRGSRWLRHWSLNRMIVDEVSKKGIRIGVANVGTIEMEEIN
jgi:hypothetical protein